MTQGQRIRLNPTGRSRNPELAREHLTGIVECDFGDGAVSVNWGGGLVSYMKVEELEAVE